MTLPLTTACRVDGRVAHGRDGRAESEPPPPPPAPTPPPPPAPTPPPPPPPLSPPPCPPTPSPTPTAASACEWSGCSGCSGLPYGLGDAERLGGRKSSTRPSRPRIISKSYVRGASITRGRTIGGDLRRFSANSLCLAMATAAGSSVSSTTTGLRGGDLARRGASRSLGGGGAPNCWCTRNGRRGLPIVSSSGSTASAAAKAVGGCGNWSTNTMDGQMHGAPNFVGLVGASVLSMAERRCPACASWSCGWLVGPPRRALCLSPFAGPTPSRNSSGDLGFRPGGHTTSPSSSAPAARRAGLCLRTRGRLERHAPVHRRGMFFHFAHAAAPSIANVPIEPRGCTQLAATKKRSTRAAGKLPPRPATNAASPPPPRPTMARQRPQRTPAEAQPSLSQPLPTTPPPKHPTTHSTRTSTSVAVPAQREGPDPVEAHVMRADPALSPTPPLQRHAGTPSANGLAQPSCPSASAPMPSNTLPSLPAGSPLRLEAAEHDVVAEHLLPAPSLPSATTTHTQQWQEPQQETAQSPPPQPPPPRPPQMPPQIYMSPQTPPQTPPHVVSGSLQPGAEQRPPESSSYQYAASCTPQAHPRHVTATSSAAISSAAAAQLLPPHAGSPHAGSPHAGSTPPRGPAMVVAMARRAPAAPAGPVPSPLIVDARRKTPLRGLATRGTEARGAAAPRPSAGGHGGRPSRGFGAMSTRPAYRDPSWLTRALDRLALDADASEYSADEAEDIQQRQQHQQPGGQHRGDGAPYSGFSHPRVATGGAHANWA